jgi:hypothetical protein
MGGQSKQTQDVSQTTSAQANPWAPATPLLQGILNQGQGLLGTTSLSPNENYAVNQLTQNALGGNPFAPTISNYATSLLGGGGATAQAGNIQGGLDAYRASLQPYASGSMVGKISPQLQQMLDITGTNAAEAINQQFAGAGRDLSGYNQRAVGQGIAQAQSPYLFNQYNQDIQNQLNAAGQLYGAGNTTAGLLTGLQQQALANRGTGVDAATAALSARDSPYNQLLNIGQIQRGVPQQVLGFLGSLGVPIAGLGGTRTGTQQGTMQVTNNPSILQQAQGWSNVFGNLAGGGKPWFLG